MSINNIFELLNFNIRNEAMKSVRNLSATKAIRSK